MIITRREFLQMDKEQIKNLRASKESLYNIRVGLIFTIDVGEGLSLISPACEMMKEKLPNYKPVRKRIVSVLDNNINSKYIVFKELGSEHSLVVSSVYKNGFMTSILASFFKGKRVFVNFNSNAIDKPKGNRLSWGNAWEFFGE